MKIAVFTDTYLPQVNGVVYFIESIYKILQKDCDIKVYAPAYSSSLAIENHDGLILERYPSFSLPHTNEIPISYPDIRKLRKSLITFNPDIVHFHTPGTLGLLSMAYAKTYHKPLIGTYHTLFSETLPPFVAVGPLKKLLESKKGRNDLLRKTIWRWSNSIFNKCNLVIVPSSTIKNEVESHGQKSPTVVLSNGIDSQKFPAKTDMALKNKLVYVGRVSTEKSIDTVLKALSHVVKVNPQVTLDIIGGGAAEDSLKQLAIKLQISKHVNFLGFINRYDLPKHYQNSDIFVTGSPMEVQPLTVLEAMSCGLPVVGVGMSGLLDLVTNDVTGYLVDVYDDKAMAARILEILSNPLKLKMMSAEAVDFDRNNDLTITAHKLKAIYQTIIDDQ